MSHTHVLIAGAGPTGLMLAVQLARLGVNFRIVDSKAGPTRESRALGVWARTLELYQALGLADAAVAQGHPTRAANIYVGQDRVQRVPLADIGTGLTPFPFLLILEQSRNEALLYGALQAAGHDVQWQVELVDFEPTSARPGTEPVAVVLRHADGRTETLTADYLVGCDGAHSMVREHLGLEFAGGTYENLFYVADTRVDAALPPDELVACLSGETFVLFFPMPGPARYRVIGILPRDAPPDVELRFEDIEAAVRRQMDIPVRFSDTAWFSAYRVHHRCVRRFGVGRALLAGDAAHVHSPVGAQGMNTGLQDACNLAWKLALVVQGHADRALLDSYHAERWPLAQRLLRTTDAAFRLIIARRPVLRWVRLRVFPVVARRVMGLAWVRRRVFPIMSQIGIHYRGGPLAPASKGLRVRAGERLPYVQIGAPLVPEPICIYQWLSAPGFHVLLLRREAGDLTPWAAHWQGSLEAAWPGWFHVHALGPGPATDALFDAVGVRDQALLLVRPDQYLAYVDARPEWAALLHYLTSKLRLHWADPTATAWRHGGCDYGSSE